MPHDFETDLLLQQRVLNANKTLWKALQWVRQIRNNNSALARTDSDLSTSIEELMQARPEVGVIRDRVEETVRDMPSGQPELQMARQLLESAIAALGALLPTHSRKALTREIEARKEAASRPATPRARAAKATGTKKTVARKAASKKKSVSKKAASKKKTTRKKAAVKKTARKKTATRKKTTARKKKVTARKKKATRKKTTTRKKTAKKRSRR